MIFLLSAFLSDEPNLFICADSEAFLGGLKGEPGVLGEILRVSDAIPGGNLRVKEPIPGLPCGNIRVSDAIPGGNLRVKEPIPGLSCGIIRVSEPIPGILGILFRNGVDSFDHTCDHMQSRRGRRY